MNSSHFALPTDKRTALFSFLFFQSVVSSFQSVVTLPPKCLKLNRDSGLKYIESLFPALWAPSQKGHLHAALNLTRNIVPDDSGHARVIDVAVWAAVRAGKPEAVRFLFVRAPTARQPDEDGHLVELAADVVK